MNKLKKPLQKKTVLQLTDLHLFTDPGERLHGIPTRKTFQEIFEYINTHYSNIDFLILTGDLAHDEKLETYKKLRDLLGQTWVERCKIIPGNHDNREFIKSVFPQSFTPNPLLPDEKLTFACRAGNWQLIGLDSHIPGEISGRIDHSQLEWLKKQLRKDPSPTLLFVHHPPMPVNVPWLDRIGLENFQELVEIVRSHPLIRCVVSGHVHHEFTGRINEAQVLTTPSTSVQFSPYGNTSSYEALPPGFRLFSLDENTFQTQVIRLPHVKYHPTND